MCGESAVAVSDDSVFCDENDENIAGREKFSIQGFSTNI
jgi:hypothetical protein